MTSRRTKTRTETLGIDVGKGIGKHDYVASVAIILADWVRNDSIEFRRKHGTLSFGARTFTEA